MRRLCHRQKGGAAVEQSAPLGLAEHPGTCPGDVRCPDSASFWHPGGGLLCRAGGASGLSGPPGEGPAGPGGQGPVPGRPDSGPVRGPGHLGSHLPGRGLSPAAGPAGQRPLRALWPGKAAPDGPGGRRGPGGGPPGQPLWNHGRRPAGAGVGPAGGPGGQRHGPGGGRRRPPGGAAGRRPGRCSASIPRAPRPPAPIFLCATASSPA